MRYWLLLVGKLMAATALTALLWVLIVAVSPHAPPVSAFESLGFLLWTFPWTLTVGAGFLIYCAAITVCVVDQLYRCRVCCRRLRMPIRNGSHSHALTDKPRTEYICTYGHGKLTVPEAELTGFGALRWTFYGDVWQELFGKQSTHQMR